MPFVNIKVLAGALDSERKAAMIKKVSLAVAEAEAGTPEGARRLLPHVWCVIEEIEPACWGIGGQGLSLENLKRLMEDKKNE